MKLVSNSGTSAPAQANLDAARLAAFHDLEHDVCSVKNMAALAANALEDFLDPTHSKGKAATDELLFAVNHVGEMAEALRLKFYAAWGNNQLG